MQGPLFDRINLMVGLLPSDFFISAVLSAEHLRWMVKEVSSSPAPLDKKVRWLGFCGGVIDTCNKTPIQDCVISHSFPEFEQMQGKAEAILAACITDVADGLRSMCETERGQQAFCILSAAKTAVQKSFSLGYLQGVLTAQGRMDTNIERDRTRPMFHKAYRECGFEIPETKR